MKARFSVSSPVRSCAVLARRLKGLVLLALIPAVPLSAAEPLRIICFGAHPDDCEIQAGGVAALWSARGHRVKLVSVTNGDIGHWREAGGPLARRRTAEVEAAARVLGVTAQVLDIHDGELLPTLENRRLLVRLIREWRADIVMGPRPNDYHPDHRYLGMLVQDAAYMVTVPFFCPDVPHLERNPVFLYYPDNFKKPNPFQPDIVIALDEIMPRKLEALGKLVSQFREGGANGGPELADPARAEARDREVETVFRQRSRHLADRFRAQLIEWYGPERGAQVQYAEAFELCEYGRQPDRAELRRLFPFFEP